MSMDLVRMAEQLRTHPWMMDARCGHAGTDTPGVVLVLSHEGIEALHQHGRRTLIEHLLHGTGYTGQAITWRLLDTLASSASAQQIDALLRAPLPRDALVLEESQQDGVWTLTLRVPVDLIYFPGHFPQAPVVPGVVQIDWALALAASRLGTPLRCQVMEALKFQHLLRPGDRADLTMHHDAVRGKLHFAYRHGDKAFSSGRLAWSAR